MSDLKEWTENLKKSLHKQVIICSNPNGYFGSYLNYKGLKGSIVGSSIIGRRIFVYIDVACKKISVNQGDFYFCDNLGNKISEPGEWFY